MDVADNNSIVGFKKMSTSNFDLISFQNTIRIVVPVILGMVILFGVIGNTLVIIAIALNRQMLNTTYLLIANLAVADLLFLILCVPYTAITYILSLWPFSDAWCSGSAYLQFVTAYASVWTLVLIAFDRYLAVVYPVESMRLRTVKNTAICMVILWCLTFLSNIPILTVFDLLINKHTTSCVFVDFATRNASEIQIHAHFGIIVSFSYFLPLTTTCILYICILRALWSKIPNDQSRFSKDHLDTARKVTRMVAVVSVTFAFCWLPINLWYMYLAIKYKQHQHMAANLNHLIFDIFAKVLAYANSCANPILYTFMSENFRKGFSHAYHVLICKEKRSSRRRSTKEEIEMLQTKKLDELENDLHTNRKSAKEHV